MANLFLNIPVPAANGAGAAVDVSAMSKSKSLVCGGGFQATVNVEYSTDDVGAGPWAPLATFQQSGNLIIDVAAHWIRAVVSSYKGGAPNLDVGSSDAGTVFALLTADGAAVDVSALPLLKTVVTPVGFVGTIDVSEDGVSWAQMFAFQNGGGVTRRFSAQFARVTGGVDVWIGGANEDGAGAGSGPSQFATARVNPDGTTICTHACAVTYTGPSGQYHVDFTPPFPNNVAVTCTIDEEFVNGAVIYAVNVTNAGFDVIARANTDGFLLTDMLWGFVALPSETPLLIEEQ